MPDNAIPSISIGQMYCEPSQARSLNARVTSGLVASGRNAATPKIARSKDNRMGLAARLAKVTAVTDRDPASTRDNITPNCTVQASRNAMPMLHNTTPMIKPRWYST